MPRPLDPRITLDQPRATVRTADRMELALAVDLLSEHTFFTGVSGNISEGGIFVAAEPQPVGSTLHIRFTLPGSDRPMMVVTEVRWISERGMGLRFVRVKPGDLERIRAFVAVRAPMLVH